MKETACTGWVKKTVQLGAATGMQAVFNNGSGVWDNNHGANYGAEGLQDSLRAARSAQFPVLGIGDDVKQAFAPYRTTLHGVRVAYGTAALLVSWVLAAVIGFATQPIYAHYASLASRPTGISSLADQQLAAGVMWVPGSIPYCVVLFIAAFRWLDPAASSRRRRLDLRPKEIA